MPAAAYLLKPPSSWTPTDLRDYLVTEMIKRNPDCGANRNPAAEIATCRAYITRHGTARAVAVARFAFTRLEGVWRDGQPIDFRKFAKGSDPYFTTQILPLLPEEDA